MRSTTFDDVSTQGPFRYCRNPMTPGTILGYLGLGIAARTLSGIGIALGIGALLIFYLKRIEERELAQRFGEPYLAYRRSVPFMFPRLPKRRTKPLADRERPL